MASKSECSASVGKKFANLSRKEINEIADLAYEKLESKSGQAALEEAVLATQQKEYMKQMREFALIKNALKNQENINRAMETNSVQGLRNILNDQSATALELNLSEGGNFLSRLDESQLLEYSQAPENQKNIAIEIENVKEGNKSTKTGDEAAYKAAQVFSDALDSLNIMVNEAGAAVNYRVNRVTRNAWDVYKFADKWAKDEFADELQKTMARLGVKVDGDVADKTWWSEFAKDVASNNYTDVVDDLLDMGKTGRGKSITIADSLGRARKIDVPAESYAEVADLFFSGETLIDRTLSEIQTVTKKVAAMETWGPDAINNYEFVRSQVAARTKSNKKFMKGTQNRLDLEEYTKQIPDKFFGSFTDSTAWSDIGNVVRNYESLRSLDMSTITALADTVTHAIRVAQYSRGPRSVTVELAKNWWNLVSSIGKKDSARIGKAVLAGMNSKLDEFSQYVRYYDKSEIFSTNSAIGRINKFIEKRFKLNQLQNWTNLNLRQSGASAMKMAYEFRDLSFSQIQKSSAFADDLLTASNINSKDWDFLRHNSIDEQFGYMSPVTLKELPLEKFEAYAGSKEPGVLKSVKRDLQRKLNNYLFKEQETMTVMPNDLDRIAVAFGSRSGTPGGEFARTVMMFKAFSYSFTSRVLTPLVKSKKGILISEAIAAMVTMNMGTMSLSYLIQGRTPPDFTKPEVMLSVVARSMGLPFVDQVVYALSSDYAKEKGLLEIATGPVFGTMAKMLAEGAKLTGKAVEGDLDGDELGAGLTKMFVPLIPGFAPGINLVQDKLIYEALMERFDPGYISEKQDRIEEKTGSQPIL